MKLCRDLACKDYNSGAGTNSCLKCSVVDKAFDKVKSRREGLASETPLEQGRDYNDYLSEMSADIASLERYKRLVKTHRAIIALRIASFTYDDIQDLLSVGRSTVKRVLTQFSQISGS